MTATVTPVDPASAHPNPAFTQGMIVPAGRLLFVGGQNGQNSDGQLAEGLAEQTRLALRNLLDVLKEAGTGPEHVAKMTIYLDPGQDPQEGFAASAEVWRHRTAVTVLMTKLGRPGALVEIEAVAAIP